MLTVFCFIPFAQAMEAVEAASVDLPANQLPKIPKIRIAFVAKPKSKKANPKIRARPIIQPTVNHSEKPTPKEPKCDIAQESKNSALLGAIKVGELQAISYLLGQGAHVESCDNGVPCLHLAIMRQHLAMVDILLDGGVRADLRDDKGNTALMCAVVEGNKTSNDADEAEAEQEISLEIMRSLLQQGADINTQGNDGMTALLLAIRDQFEAKCDLLIDYYANIFLPTCHGNTPLYAAAHFGNDEIFTMLTDFIELLEVDVKYVVNAENLHGETPLMAAARQGNDGIVVKLITAEADVNARTKKNWTALLFALANGSPTIAARLLQNGAEATIKTDEGLTPLMLAAAKNYVTLIKVLIECNALVNSKNNHGLTPLFFAVANGHHLAVKALLHKGACIGYTIKGVSALALAIHKRYDRIADELRSAGAHEIKPLSKKVSSRIESLLSLFFI